VYLTGVIIVLVLSFFFLNKKGSFGIYIIAFMTFIGWIVSFYLIGVGLVVLPYEFLYSYLNQPKKVTQGEFDVLK